MILENVFNILALELRAAVKEVRCPAMNHFILHITVTILYMTHQLSAITLNTPKGLMLVQFNV